MSLDDAFGNIIDDEPQLPATFAAKNSIARNRDFSLVENRRRIGYGETLIVDCRNDGVPTRNSVDIRYRERLALTFYVGERLPDVFALRADFPVTLHQNASPYSQYKSLCLYVETWSGLRRTWTPEKHLRRILWWLAETASGTLHQPGQPLEQVYFQSPFELVLPYDFEQRVNEPGYELTIEGRQGAGQEKATLIGRMVPRSQSSAGDFPCLVLTTTPVVHGPIEVTPQNLGQLQDQFQRRGTSFSSVLHQTIIARCSGNHFPNTQAQRTFLILRVPLLRDVGGVQEGIDVKGFLVEMNVAELGVASGALDKTEDGYWSVPMIGATRQEQQGWRNCNIASIEIARSFTPKLARQTNGIADDGPIGVLAGVGALGSEICNLWARSGWGKWTIIDPDYIRPHNLARHHALEDHIGFNKVDVVKYLADHLITGQPSSVAAICDRASNLGNANVRSALETAALVIDATTTLDFSRDLAANDSVRRAASVFVTPSGRGGVLLMEDTARLVRLDCLEAQYYRRIISQSWGADHLAGNHSQLWIGAGCRDVSAVIPNEHIGIHGANLAAMLRRHAAQANPALRVWNYDPNGGSISVDEWPAVLPEISKLNDWEIVWDDELRQKLRSQRRTHLPNETGGVLLGYFDRILKRVFIVDALPAPPDSAEDPTGFVRGTAGLEEAVKDASNRTANIVGYVGEWHSHPRNHSASPSGEDVLLLGHLATALTHEGQPALMLIIGEGEERWLTAEIM